MDLDLVHIQLLAEAGSGIICFKWRCYICMSEVHDKIIIMCYAQLNEVKLRS